MARLPAKTNRAGENYRLKPRPIGGTLVKDLLFEGQGIW
jgi:hypothetical protein